MPLYKVQNFGYWVDVTKYSCELCVARKVPSDLRDQEGGLDGRLTGPRPLDAMAKGRAVLCAVASGLDAHCEHEVGCSKSPPLLAPAEPVSHAALPPRLARADALTRGGWPGGNSFTGSRRLAGDRRGAEDSDLLRPGHWVVP